MELKASLARMKENGWESTATYRSVYCKISALQSRRNRKYEEIWRKMNSQRFEARFEKLA